MDTLTTEEPATQESTDTPVLEETEETTTSDTSTDEKQEDAATLQKRLADKDRYIKELESKKKEVPDDRSGEIKDLEWRLENKDRITLVQEEYDKILVDGFDGDPVSKKIALELAEKRAKVSEPDIKRARQNDMNVPAVTNRNANPQGYETEVDQRFGLTIEKKRKLEELHPHLKEKF
jgi:hypothetical protein